MVVGVGLLPVLAVTAIVHHSIDGLRDRETSRVAESARNVADHIDSEVSTQVQSLRTAASVALPGTPELWYQPGVTNPLVSVLNRHVLSNPGTEFAMLVGLDGSPMGVSTVDDLGRPNRARSVYENSFRDAEWFRDVVEGNYTQPHEHRDTEYREQGGGVVLVGPLREQALSGLLAASHGNSLLVAAPVQAGNEVVGYWVNLVRFSVVEERIQELAVQSSASFGAMAVSVLAADGTLLVEYDPSSFEGSGLNRDAEVVGVMKNDSSQALLARDGGSGVSNGTHRTRSSEQVVGFTHLRGTADYPGLSWSVVVHVPADELYARTDAIWQRLLMALGAALPVLLIGGFVLSREVTKPILAVARSAEPMAAGDFSGEVPVLGDGEVGTMACNLNDIAISMSRVLGNVKQTSQQIIGTSGEVSGASSALADNASRSAAALEEISASMATLSKQTKANAASATTALDLATTVSDQADESTVYMERMVSSMDEISISSERISQIIKVIDEIAFQTNLLALNAAVEAARAGQHGKGFAVVAEEVRTLAARSAKAARETSSLIQDSLEKVEQGTEVARKTADSLGQIVSGIGLVSSLMTEVASASSEQAGGISEIDQGLMQVDDGVQGNTASAEELAASARELSARAYELEEVVAGLSLREVGFGFGNSSDFVGDSDSIHSDFTGGSAFASEEEDFGISAAGSDAGADDGGYDEFGF